MRLLILFALATYVALVIQTAVPLWFPFHALIPNLIIILVVDLGLRHHSALAVLIAFAMGYATDAFSGTHVGLYAFLTTLIFLLAYYVSSRLLVTNVMVGVVAVFFGVIVTALGGVAMVSGRGAAAVISAAAPSILLQAAISAIVAPLIFAFLAGAKRFIGLPAKLERE